MSNMLKAIRVLPDGTVEPTEIEDTLKSFQNEVKGYIETFQLESQTSTRKILAVINEEGRFIYSNPTVVLETQDKKMEYRTIRKHHYHCKQPKNRGFCKFKSKGTGEVNRKVQK